MWITVTAGIAVADTMTVCELRIGPLRPHPDLIDGGFGRHAEFHRIVPAVLDGECLHMGDFTLPFQKQRAIVRFQQLLLMLELLTLGLLLLTQRQLVLFGLLPTGFLLLP